MPSTRLSSPARNEGLGVTVLDVAVLGIAGLMGALLLMRTLRNLRQLAAQEPSARARGLGASV